MNGLEATLSEARSIASWLDAHAAGARVALCPPATLISRMAEALAGTGVEIGAQDCSPHARLVILGHSERRQGHGERNADVAAKVVAAVAGSLEPIVCVGESLEERRAGCAIGVVTAQTRSSLPALLADHAFSVAYEPVWAIGSGLTPSIGEIKAVHEAIRGALREKFGDAGDGVPILYGGSVKAENAAEILRIDQVGGALVGGASLSAEAFTAILAAA